MEENNLQFNPEVSRVVFDSQRRIDRCLEHISSVPLVDENEMASRNSDFQVIHRAQKRKLHEYHVQQKRCRLAMREDIMDAFWNVYEQQALKGLNELIHINHSFDLTSEQMHAFVMDAILSVDKNKILKLWREQCMFLIPVVEQHEMVPFHDRWIKDQFKEEENIQKMQERLCARSNECMHWLTELVSELTASSDGQPLFEFHYDDNSEKLNEPELIVHPEIFEDLKCTEESAANGDELIESSENAPPYELNYEQLSDALNELESLHPGIFEDVQLTAESTPGVNELTDSLNSPPTPEDLTDDTLLQAMEAWEEAEMALALDMSDYIYLMQDEVS